MFVFVFEWLGARAVRNQHSQIKMRKSCKKHNASITVMGFWWCFLYLFFFLIVTASKSWLFCGLNLHCCRQRCIQRGTQMRLRLRKVLARIPHYSWTSYFRFGSQKNLCWWWWKSEDKRKKDSSKGKTHWACWHLVRWPFEDPHCFITSHSPKTLLLISLGLWGNRHCH